MELNESIILAVLAAALVKRPILVSSPERAEKTVALCQKAISTLFETNKSPVIRCEKWTSWKSLENDLAHASRISAYIIVVNPGALDHETQAVLTEQLQKASFTAFFVGSATELRRILREVIFFEIKLCPEDGEYLVSESHKGVQNRLDELRDRASKVHISAELKRYTQDLMVHIRTHRFVSRGVSPSAVLDVEKLVRILGMFAGLDYATPSVVTSAVKLVIPFRIELVEAGDDISLEYGGDLDVVSSWLKNWDTVLVVDTAIESIPVPL